MKGATSIQERLWELRKDKGLNLEELSKLTGISKSALGNYEKEDYKEINHGNLITLQPTNSILWVVNIARCSVSAALSLSRR